MGNSAVAAVQCVGQAASCKANCRAPIDDQILCRIPSFSWQIRHIECNTSKFATDHVAYVHGLLVADCYIEERVLNFGLKVIGHSCDLPNKSISTPNSRIRFGRRFCPGHCPGFSNEFYVFNSQSLQSLRAPRLSSSVAPRTPPRTVVAPRASETGP